MMPDFETASYTSNAPLRLAEDAFSPDTHVVCTEPASAGTMRDTSRIPTNEKSLVAYLIPEVLSDIMLHVMVDHKVQWMYIPAEYAINRREIGPYKWLSIAGVCRYWRDVAVSTPRLWSAIHVAKEQITKIMLARSHNAPLSVYVPSRWNGQSTRQVFEHESHRIQELYIDSIHTVDVWRDVFEPILISGGIPALQVFHAHIPGIKTLPFGSKAWFPRLQDLYVREYSSASVQQLFSPSLTRLTLYRVTDAEVTVDALLDALRQMQLLELLTLDNAIKQIPEDTPSLENWTTLSGTHDVVVLPCLSYLHLSEYGNGVTSASFLNQISFPTKASINFVYGSDAQTDFRLVIPLIAKRWAGDGLIGEMRPPWCLSVDLTSLNSLTIIAGRNGSEDIQMLRIESVMQLGISRRDRRQYQSTFIQLFFSLLPTRHVKEVQDIRIVGQILHAIPSLRSFVHMTIVKMLRLDQHSVRFFPSILCEDIQTIGTGEQNPVSARDPLQTSAESGRRPFMLFPQLDTIVVTATHHFADGYSTSPIGIFKNLANAMIVRAENQFPVATLKLYGFPKTPQLDALLIPSFPGTSERPVQTCAPAQQIEIPGQQEGLGA